jgi:hypothetical protein
MRLHCAALAHLIFLLHSQVCVLQHSPSNGAESEAAREVLDLRRGERLSECVCDHVGGGAVNKAEGAPLNNPTNKMIADIDVLGPRVVMVVLRESNRGLIVRKDGGGFLDRGEGIF